MVKINLLPAENRPLSYSMFRVLFIIALFPIVGIICVFSHSYFIIQNLEVESFNAQEQYLTYAKAVQQKAKVDKRLELLNSKESALARITKSQELWRKILTELSVVTPSDVWLVDFSMANNMIINIKGNAGSYSGIASLIKLLDENPLFENPVLITSGVTDSSSKSASTATPDSSGISAATGVPINTGVPTISGVPATTVTEKKVNSTATKKSIANFEIIVQVRGQ